MEREKDQRVPRCSSLHVVMMPFPDQGHLNPMLHLARHLASSWGATITFLCTHRFYHRLVEESSSAAANYNSNQLGHLRFVAIPDGLTPDQSSYLDVEVSMDGPIFSSSRMSVFRGLEEQAPVLESLIRSFHTDGPRVSCLISDAFLPWTAQIARKCNVKWFVLWAACATRLCISMYAAEELKTTGPEEYHLELNIPGLPFVKEHAAGFRINSFWKPHLTRMKALKHADGLIINSFNDLEKEALSLVPWTVPVLTVGPILFYGLTESSTNEDATCFQWLDKQEKHSVVYIAFGSMVLLQKQLLHQLALGIEASGKPFLWVIRSKEQHQQLEGLMKEFNLQTQGRGVIVSWAPQVRVLEHVAVGAFVTHCGWNSVLESIAMGVPMVCCPVFGDQFTNRLLVEHQWRVGRGIDVTKLQANDVAVAIKDVIEDEGMRHRANDLSGFAQVAMQRSGSSYQYLEALIQG